MAKVPVYNFEGKELEKIDVADAVFAVEVDPKLVQFVANAQRSNAAHPYAHTKTRGEVSGGGRKPWKQKGNGRARQGSIRSPQWKGGGVVFGPRNTKNPEKKVNVKTRRLAIRMVLSDKLAEQKLVVVDSFTQCEGKTKALYGALGKLPSGHKSALIAVGSKSAEITRAARNIQKVNTVMADSVNVGDLLKHQYLVIDKAGIEKLSTHFA